MCISMFSIPFVATSAMGLALVTVIEVVKLIIDIVKQWSLWEKNLITTEEFISFLKHRMTKFGTTWAVTVGITIGAALIATGR